MLESSATAMSAIPPGFRVVGVRVDAVQLAEAVTRIKRWIDNRENGKYVAVTGMHGVAESRQDPRFREILNQAALVVPDGMPLVWLGRWHGHSLRRRVTGSELMLAFCRETGPHPRHFFYGGAPGVAEDLARQPTRLPFARSRRPKKQISPPRFRPRLPMFSGWASALRNRSAGCLTTI
jgi:UDP-N-acetyl-D-mannosaminuronic acid transferase (WecB/TagA/CpsF family)